MGLVLRKMLSLFFCGIKRYGYDKFIEILKIFQEECIDKIINSIKWKKWEVIKHMSHDYHEEEAYKLTFTKDFTLLGFEILNFSP